MGANRFRAGERKAPRRGALGAFGGGPTGGSGPADQERGEGFSAWMAVQMSMREAGRGKIFA